MMTSRSSISLLSLLLLCSALQVGWARRPAGAPAPGAPAALGDRAFEQHLERGMNLYKQGEYAEAIRELHAAYAIRQMPRLLLNLGQAHRKLGHAREALGFYEMYLKIEPEPRPELKQELDRYIAQARTMIQAAERTRAELGQSAEDPHPAPPAERPQAPGVPAAALSAAAPAAATPGTRPALQLAPVGPPPAKGMAKAPLHRQWWLWTAVGAVVAGGVVTGAVLGSQRGPGVPTDIEIHGLSH